jgi:DNA (cytosine-5)-methyltransferase 1
MTTRNETALAFIAELRGGGSRYRPISERLATVTASGNHHGLVTTYYGNGSTTPTTEALSTCTTVERHALLTKDIPAVDISDVLFRMLEPSEIKRAMDFPVDYTILGNRREQVRMSGNAVTPPAARDLIGVVAESLGVPA